MHVRHETAAQIHHRLTRVIAAAEVRVLKGIYAYTEYPASAFPADRAGVALAFVRDDEVWSVLGPARGDEPELLGMMAFHFPPNVDNSGFVGWLASHLKATFGMGIVVVCGSNSARGGIFDYYGVPLAMLDQAVAAVQSLRDGPAVTRLSFDR